MLLKPKKTHKSVDNDHCKLIGVFYKFGEAMTILILY